LHAVCDVSSSSYISTFNCNEEDSGFVIFDSAKAPDRRNATEAERLIDVLRRG